MTKTLEQLQVLVRDMYATAPSDDDLDRILPVVWAAEQQLAAYRLALIRQASRSDLPRRRGAARTSAWLAGKLCVSVRAAAAMTRLATELDTVAQATAARLAAGKVSVDQATVVVDALRGLPERVRSDGEAHLLELARQFAPPQLRKQAVYLQDVADPDGARQRRRKPSARSERGDTEHGITLSRIDDDLWQLRGQMNAETATVIQAAIDPSSSHLHHQATSGADALDDTPADRADTQVDAGGISDIREPAADPRTAAARRLDALKDVCLVALAHGQRPAGRGDRSHFPVTVPLRMLRDHVGSATLVPRAATGPRDTRQRERVISLLSAPLGDVSMLSPIDQACRPRRSRRHTRVSPTT